MTNLPTLPVQYFALGLLGIVVVFIILRNKILSLFFALDVIVFVLWQRGYVPLSYTVYAIISTILWAIMSASAGGKNRDVRRVMPVRFWTFRFFSGQHLDGYRRTNGTFLYRGTKPLGGLVRASAWAYLAGWERLAIRLVVTLLTPILTVGYFAGPGYLKVVIWTLIIGLIGYLLYRLGRWIVHFLPSEKVGESTPQSAVGVGRNSEGRQSRKMDPPT